MNRIRLGWPWAASLAVHAIIFAFLFLRSEEKLRVRREAPVVLELQGPARTPAPKSRRRTRETSRETSGSGRFWNDRGQPTDHRKSADSRGRNGDAKPRTQSSRITSLKQLQPGLWSSDGVPLPSQGNGRGNGVESDSADGRPLVDNPKSDWGSGGGQFKRIEDFGLMSRLYEQIDSMLVYPGILARNKVEGTVNARIVLSAEGKCDWSLTMISAADPNLRIYILDVLKRLCRQEFSRFVRDRKLSNIDLSFRFAITEHNDLGLIEAEKKIVGNVLMFYRNSQQSVAEWHIGPFRGMFPVPFVAVDFGWLKENWDRVVNGRDSMKEWKAGMGEE